MKTTFYFKVSMDSVRNIQPNLATTELMTKILQAIDNGEYTVGVIFRSCKGI